jgi:2-polyprenyl-3-methyl-5-hydroxy-6-metoxy-1,4-benzoquinol methylase
VKIVNPEYSVEMIVQRMKEAAARAQNTESTLPLSGMRTESPSNFASRTISSDLDIHPITLQPTFQPNPEDHYDVADLLKFNDRQFVVNAYRAILKRGADEAGYAGLIDGLRSGEFNKIDILAKLRFSREGREKGVQLDGLLVPALMRKLYRVPLVGYLLNFGVALVRLPVMVRNHRQFESHMIAQQETLVSQINHIGHSLLKHANEQSQGLNENRSSLEQLKQHLEQIANEQTALHEVVVARHAELSRYLEDRLNDEAAQRQSDVWTLGQRIERAEANAESSSRRMLAQYQELQKRQQALTAETILLGQRLTRWLDRRSVSSPTVSVEKHEDEHLLDAFYASFDEQFRGEREAIKDRLKVYLPFVQRANVGVPEGPIVDIGCGRGEWLELIKEEGLNGEGVDSNTVLAEQCRIHGQTVANEDLNEYLAKVPDNTLRAVTGFHIVEHLPIERLVDLLNETMRVLKPGGVVIFETPNPRNVLVGTCNFYFDPTHRNPIPSEVLRFLLESRGFSDIEVLPLNPSDEMPVAGDTEIARRFNEYFYGPMDYGIVGSKPRPITNTTS